MQRHDIFENLNRPLYYTNSNGHTMQEAQMQEAHANYMRMRESNRANLENLAASMDIALGRRPIEVQQEYIPFVGNEEEVEEEQIEEPIKKFIPKKREESKAPLFLLGAGILLAGFFLWKK